MASDPTRNRTFYSRNPEAWIKARRIARVRGESLSSVLDKAVEDYVEANAELAAAVDAAMKKDSKTVKAGQEK